MPVNKNVDECIAQLVPSIEEYYLFYPEMKGLIPEQHIVYEINTNELLDKTFRDFCDKSWESLDPNMCMMRYYNLLHTLVNFKYLHRKVTNGMSM